MACVMAGDPFHQNYIYSGTSTTLPKNPLLCLLTIRIIGDRSIIF